MQQQFSMADHEIMDDVLSSQKHITGMYNTYSCECVNQNLKNEFMNILREEQTIQHNVFSEMQKRGWYAPDPAQAQKVMEAKTKFQNISTQMT